MSVTATGEMERYATGVFPKLFVGYTNVAIEEGLRRFESPVADSLPNKASTSQVPNMATSAGRWTVT